MATLEKVVNGGQWRFRKDEIDDWLEHNRGYKKGVK